ncbi:MAG: Gfo/Idh/MocA family oxidoreductase [Proteobacteria bacterium]|nr:Gfo/Idh/MocA family oxidoreductase [Pseudomonadota bacterium]
MNSNPVLALLGRRLRLAVIGGGPGSFIGPMHRLAARLDDCYDLVAGVLSSDPERAISRAGEIGLAPGRGYASVAEMLEMEKGRPDGAEVVAIMTPNDSHFTYAMAALDYGFHLICDKPMTNSLSEARKLHARVIEEGTIFCLTHNYTGYPMARQARAMVAAGELGTIRLVQVEYVQGNRADGSMPDPVTGPRSWKNIREKSGPSLVLGDIGSHAHNLLRFIAGLEVVELCAERGAIVPGRQVDDFAGALLRLENGARGSYWVTQAAAGMGNGLQIRVSGTKATIEWRQETPQFLTFRPLVQTGLPIETRVANGPGTLPLAARSCRVVAGHPEGFPEGFANLYKDAAEVIASRLAGVDPDPLVLHFPTSADGLAGALFIDAIIRSSDGDGWVQVHPE